MDKTIIQMLSTFVKITQPQILKNPAKFEHTIIKRCLFSNAHHKKGQRINEQLSYPYFVLRLQFHTPLSLYLGSKYCEAHFDKKYKGTHLGIFCQAKFIVQWSA